jgi:hypothetical protein
MSSTITSISESITNASLAVNGHAGTDAVVSSRNIVGSKEAKVSGDLEDKSIEEFILRSEPVDDDDDAPVVRQQQLTEIFDIGPAFALPPVEDLFEQVVGLFSRKPASTQTGVKV